MSDTEPKAFGKGAVTRAAWTDTERVRHRTLIAPLLLTLTDGIPYHYRRACPRHPHRVQGLREWPFFSSSSPDVL
jgi:hypothetical protein